MMSKREEKKEDVHFVEEIYPNIFFMRKTGQANGKFLSTEEVIAEMNGDKKVYINDKATFYPSNFYMNKDKEN